MADNNLSAEFRGRVLECLETLSKNQDELDSRTKNIQRSINNIEIELQRLKSKIDLVVNYQLKSLFDFKKSMEDEMKARAEEDLETRIKAKTLWKIFLLSMAALISSLVSLIFQLI